MAAKLILHTICFLGLTVPVTAVDDVSLQALQSLVQEQASTITDLAAKLTVLQDEVTTLEDLKTEVTGLKEKVAILSKAVAFTAMFSTDNGDDGISLGAHSTLLFNNAITNIGNGYNPQTGVFTTPVAGVYAFFLTIMAPHTHGPLGLDIVKHGVILDRAWAPDTDDPDDQGSTQVTTHLESGEQVWVRQYDGDAVRGGYWTTFTGCLLQAD